MVNEKSAVLPGVGRYEYQERCFETTVKYDRDQGKKITLNGRKTIPITRIVCVGFVFTRTIYILVKGSPSRRRFFFDFFLKQASTEYGYQLDNYVKILRKRNALVKK